MGRIGIHSCRLRETANAHGTVFMPEREVMEQVVIGLFADPEGYIVGLCKSIRSRRLAEISPLHRSAL